MEVTREEARAHLGMETQRQWNARAIARTTPALLSLYSIITLTAHQLFQKEFTIVRATAWYAKIRPTFVDASGLVRGHLWDHMHFSVSSHEMVAPQLTVVSTPPLNQALQCTRGASVLCGWCPTWWRHMKRQQFTDRPAMAAGVARRRLACGVQKLYTVPIRYRLCSSVSQRRANARPRRVSVVRRSRKVALSRSMYVVLITPSSCDRRRSVSTRAGAPEMRRRSTSTTRRCPESLTTWAILTWRQGRMSGRLRPLIRTAAHPPEQPPHQRRIAVRTDRARQPQAGADHHGQRHPYDALLGLDTNVG